MGKKLLNEEREDLREWAKITVSSIALVESKRVHSG